MKNKVVAALFAFFLGGFGAHKFYLGEVGWGITYLVFCWTGIPWIAGFIEFLYLLSMDDQGFDRRFNERYLTTSDYNYNVLQEAQGLEKLAELKNRGLLTDEEFEAKRRQILERM
jgi:TM2 domain-containing membrane protein YozV